MVGRQLYAPAAFIPGEIPGTHFQGPSRPQGTWFCRREPRQKSPVTPPGIDPGTARLVAQRLDHYATPGPNYDHYRTINSGIQVEIRCLSSRMQGYLEYLRWSIKMQQIFLSCLWSGLVLQPPPPKSSIPDIILRSSEM